MINFAEQPREGSQSASIKERQGVSTAHPDGARKDSYEWNLSRCQNPAHFHLIEVGESMRTIRDRELFREEHQTWEDFCREKLKISVNQAERRIRCAEIASELFEADCVHLPFKESQCRPLMRLEPKLLRIYAWELTCSLTVVGKAPTGNDVMRAVNLLESWRAPKDEVKRGYFDLRKFLYGSRISIKLAENIFRSTDFQRWLEKDASKIERGLLKALVEDLVRRLRSLKVSAE